MKQCMAHPRKQEKPAIQVLNALETVGKLKQSKKRGQALEHALSKIPRCKLTQKEFIRIIKGITEIIGEGQLLDALSGFAEWYLSRPDTDRINIFEKEWRKLTRYALKSPEVSGETRKYLAIMD